MRLVDHGIPPSRAEVDAIGWMFALAERAAHRWGHKALAMVRTTALAIAEVADEVLARTQRNLALDIGGMRSSAPQWVSQLATAAGRIGLDVGAAALRSQLDKLGIGDDMVGLVEQELNHEGLSLGVLAHPPKLTTFATMQKKSRVTKDSIRSPARMVRARAQGFPAACGHGRALPAKGERREEGRGDKKHRAREPRRDRARLAAAVRSGEGRDRLGARHRGEAVARLRRGHRGDREGARVRARVARRPAAPRCDVNDLLSTFATILFAAIEIDLGIDSVELLAPLRALLNAPSTFRACCAARARRATSSRPS